MAPLSGGNGCGRGVAPRGDRECAGTAACPTPTSLVHRRPVRRCVQIDYPGMREYVDKLVQEVRCPALPCPALRVCLLLLQRETPGLPAALPVARCVIGVHPSRPVFSRASVLLAPRRASRPFTCALSCPRPPARPPARPPPLACLPPSSSHTVPRQEMGRFEPRDYIAHLPPVPEPRGVHFEPLDDSRYSVEAPSGAAAEDVDAWRKAVANAQAQLEHTLLREVNLDLLAKFGPAAWRMHCAEVEAMAAGCVAHGGCVRVRGGGGRQGVYGYRGVCFPRWSTCPAFAYGLAVQHGCASGGVAGRD
jgi:hypothetical protein